MYTQFKEPKSLWWGWNYKRIHQVDIKSIYKFYEKLFNIIFDKGFVPHIWLIGTIKHIYKNNDDIYERKNNRPITIVSCLGKLFSSILNTRLNNFSEEYRLIAENQFGFRQNYSTIDNMFTLFSFFQILKLKKRKLCCAFIYFDKGLW